MDQIENYIQNQSENHRIIYYKLRELILKASPKIVEKFSYQCPFYYYRKPLCYMYTSKKKKEKVLLGFCQGVQLSNEQGILTAIDRKQIRILEVNTNKKTDWLLVREVLNEAVLLQEILYN
ncbi:MAG: DUF1801 domain-containing protein [Cyclobacteriaceae bacterium]|nr:DUF1801 domain-containing protein [Cyclobacteriaceae bacterium]